LRSYNNFQILYIVVYGCTPGRGVWEGNGSSPTDCYKKIYIHEVDRCYDWLVARKGEIRESRDRYRRVTIRMF